MTVLVYQAIIIGSLWFTFDRKPAYGIWVAWAWTAETLLLVYTTPLATFQLLVIWLAYRHFSRRSTELTSGPAPATVQPASTPVEITQAPAAQSTQLPIAVHEEVEPINEKIDRYPDTDRANVSIEQMFSEIERKQTQFENRKSRNRYKPWFVTFRFVLKTLFVILGIALLVMFAVDYTRRVLDDLEPTEPTVAPPSSG